MKKVVLTSGYLKKNSTPSYGQGFIDILSWIPATESKSPRNLTFFEFFSILANPSFLF